MRALENSFFWPPHWQRVIYKIRVYKDPIWMGNKYTVLAKNPEHADYTRNVSVSDVRTILPPMYLPEPMEFDTVEELDIWARVAARID